MTTHENRTQATQSEITVLYTPAPDDPTPGSMYPRVICLEHSGERNGTFLATFEQYRHEPPVFPVYRSVDEGRTWILHSEIADQVNGWGLRYQPHLYELPSALGDMPAGTILAAGNSIPKDWTKTKIDLYKSTDGGSTWSFLSSLALGGKPEIYEDAVWEPFLLLDGNGDLVCYYSDERKKSEGYNQLLLHRVSKDGIHWGPEVYDVAVPDGVTRPGMAVVSRLANGSYMMTYEVMDGPGMPNCPMYYKLSPDGLDWGDPSDLGSRVQTQDGQFLGATPYHVWTPTGGPNGMIVAAGKGYRTDTETVSTTVYLVNYNNGEGPWHLLPSRLEHDDSLWFTGWSRSMAVYDGGRKIMQLSPVQIRDKQAEIRCATTTLE